MSWRKNTILNHKLFLPILLAFFFSLIYSTWSVYRHLNFGSNAFDLGIYTQASYLYSQGLTPYSTLKHMIILADHFGPILWVLSPIYKIFPYPETLLIIQGLFVGLSCVPIYLIALDKLKDKVLSLLITLAYITSIGITAAVNFDFHLTTISVLPLSLLLFFWYFRHWRLYWITLFLSLLFKEDIPIFILGLGLYQIFNRERKLGIATTFSALLSFYLIKFKIMPQLWPGSEGGYLSTSILFSTDPITLIYLLITNPKLFMDQIFNTPVKMTSFNDLYRQFAFLPVLSIFGWLTVFPYLYIRFTSTYTQLWTNDFHHSANLIPFLAISTIFAIKKFNLPKLPVTLLLIFFLFTGGLSPNSIVWTTILMDKHPSGRYTQMNHDLKLIPDSAAVSAQSSLLPHLANRQKIYLYPEIYDSSYIVLDKSQTTYPLNTADFNQKLKTLESSQDWSLVKKDGTLLIFKQVKK